MDLRDFDVVADSNKGSVLELRSPYDNTIVNDGKGKDPNNYYVKLLGEDSDVFRNSVKRDYEKSLKKKNDDVEKDIRDSAQRLAKCTIDCYFLESEKEGEKPKPVDCTTQEMFRIYMKYPWIREQVQVYMKDRANFTKG